MCVIGRNTFVGAGSTFTDFNLLPLPIRALDGDEQLAHTNRPVLGGCVGHNCRLGAGIVVSPARTIESDVVIISSQTRRVITDDVRYEDSDHHGRRGAELHQRLYPRLAESEKISW
jgi:carbonic anhydrase/acetyltransferase-like protein (isoleucine patch superfamily)